MLPYIITIGNISRQEKANNKNMKLYNFITILKKRNINGTYKESESLEDFIHW